MLKKKLWSLKSETAAVKRCGWEPEMILNSDKQWWAGDNMPENCGL